MSGAIFLDRDGTLNVKAPPHKYVTSIVQFRFLPGALDALAFLAKNSERRIVIVTNQAGIERGTVKRSHVDALHQWMRRRIKYHGGRIDAIYVCPHTDGCDCRKPAPGLFFQASADLDLDLAQSVMVGDQETDRQAAEAAGVGAFYLLSAPEDWPAIAEGILEGERDARV